ncbi:MAG: cupin domain-containing protein [Thermoleophilia bacterium]|nr:cupin domain-containing protein [Thermoleophilia bacterium]
MTETIDLGATVVHVLAAEEAVTVLEVELAPGSGSPPHVHTREDETIVALEGSLVVDDGERRELAPRAARFLRRGTRHSFANPGDERTRALFVCTPGGLERFFREVAAARSDADVAAASERAGLLFG